MPVELGRQGREGMGRTRRDGRTMATDLAVGGSGGTYTAAVDACTGGGISRRPPPVRPRSPHPDYPRPGPWPTAHRCRPLEEVAVDVTTSLGPACSMTSSCERGQRSWMVETHPGSSREHGASALLIGQLAQDALVRLAHQRLEVGGCLPDTGGAVARGGRDTLAIRRPCHTFDHVLMTLESGYLAAIGRFPYPRRTVA